MAATPTASSRKPARLKVSCLSTTQRTVNNHGDGKLFDRTEFIYDEATDTFRCPAGQTLWRKQFPKKDRNVTYTPRRKVCGPCALKARCTLGPRRYVSRHLHEGTLQRTQQRTTPAVMRLRAATVESPFAALKYRIFGNPRFLLRGLAGADGGQLGHVGLQLETNAECSKLLSAPRCSSCLSKHRSRLPHLKENYFERIYLPLRFFLPAFVTPLPLESPAPAALYWLSSCAHLRSRPCKLCGRQVVQRRRCSL